MNYEFAYRLSLLFTIMIVLQYSDIIIIIITAFIITSDCDREFEIYQNLHNALLSSFSLDRVCVSNS